MERVRAALRLAGVDQAKYCSHSFRIGAATTAAAKGVEDCALGRWEHTSDTSEYLVSNSLDTRQR